MRAPAGAEHGVGLRIEQGTHQESIVVGVVLQVGVLNDHQILVSGIGGQDLIETGLQCGSLALIDLVTIECDGMSRISQGIEDGLDLNLVALVGMIVDDPETRCPAFRQRHAKHAFQTRFKRLRLVEYRYDDMKKRHGRNAGSSVKPIGHAGR